MDCLDLRMARTMMDDLAKDHILGSIKCHPHYLLQLSNWMLPAPKADL